VAASTVISAWQRLHGDAISMSPPSRWDMALTFLLTGGIPFLWLLRTRARPLTGTLDYLRLRNLRRAAPWGLLVGLSMASIGAIALRAVAAPLPPLVELLRTAWFFCLVAPVGEEILFRGILQPRIGVLAQALAFAAMHVATVNVLEGILVLAFGAALGLAARRWGLWASIVAHATYNLAALL
jgi:membrane protease YdiL (CAAX protease family)